MIGFIGGTFVSSPMLTVLFSDYKPASISQLARHQEEMDFSIGLGFAAAAIFFSALVTERFARGANYKVALAKSVFVGLLLAAVSVFYQKQALASRQRIVKTLNLSSSGAANPLAVVIWITGVGLIIFGPVDLWIARLQARHRAEGTVRGPEIPL